MEGLNKFKILTIVFLCMFIFVIAAIYTNTREVTENKTQSKQNEQKEQITDEVSAEQNTISQDNAQIEELALKVENLNRRLDEMNTSANGTRLNCNVHGVVNGDSIEQLTQEAAMQEAKVNGKELVMLCSF